MKLFQFSLAVDLDVTSRAATTVMEITGLECSINKVLLLFPKEKSTIHGL